MEQSLHNHLSAYLREKYNKALSRFEKGLESGRFASYSKQKKAQIWTRLNRYAKQLGIALKPGLITACLAAGLCLSSAASAQSFAVQTGAANPFDGVDVGNFSAPTFVDIDGDGDTDAFIGEFYGTIKYYKNTGTTIVPIFVAQIGFDNPFDGVNVGFNSAPTFVDIDGDGDKDAFIGNDLGTIEYYKNMGTTTTPVFVAQIGFANPFDGVDVGSNSKPTFVDIDGDGDKDAFIGEVDGIINYYTNTGTIPNPVFVAQTGPNNPFDGVDVGYESTPTFVDIDGDGDIDTFIGSNQYGTILHYKNTGTTTAPVFVAQTGANNPFDGVNVGVPQPAPTFVDIDGDGDKEVFIGEGLGTIKSYKKTTTVAVNFINLTSVDNPLNGVDVGLNSTPTFVDIDGDGDKDAFSGERYGTINYYKNTGTTTAPVFVAQTGAANPFGGVAVGYLSAPTFADIDGDGDQDAFSGELFGTIKYYKNTGTTTAPVFAAQTGANNPFNGVDVGYHSKPTFVDIDGDGDKDAFIGESDGTILYYKNTGTTTAPVFVAQTGAANPLNWVSAVSTTPTFVDIDGDGDQDAFSGELFGTIKYYKNTGTTTAPVFVVQIIGAANPFDGVDVGYNSTPTFVDIDGDGDKDAFIGEKYGSIKYYQNTSPLPPPVFALGASSTRCQTTETLSYAATGATSYSLTGGGTSTINASTGEVSWDAAFAGTATVVATGAGGSTNHTITVNPAATPATITAINTSACAGASLTLTGTGTGGTATEFAWFKDGIYVKYDTQPDYVITVKEGTASYTLVVIYGGSCPSTLTSTPLVVTGIAPTAVITPSAPAPYCVGSAPTLSATTGVGYTYSWIGTSPTAATTTTSTFVPTNSGNHRVIVTDANGCSKISAWMGITLNSLPAVNPGTNKSTCVNNGVSIGVVAAAGLSYSWTPSTHLSSATASNPTVMPTATGAITYTLTVTNAKGCKNTGNVSITTAAQPATPNLTGTSSSVCQGTSITLSPSGVTGAVNWYKNNVLFASATTAAARVFSAVNTSADNYMIRAKIGTCLSVASNSLPVEIKAAPTPILSATPAIVGNIVSVCNPGMTSGTAQLMVNLPPGSPIAATYNWQQFISGVATNINPIATGNTYTVAVSKTSNNKAFRAQVTYSNGCVKNSANVTVKLLPSTCTGRAGQGDYLTEAIFTAYPNPTEDVLHINIQNSKVSEGELVLYNTLGQVITSRTISLSNGSIEESLDVSGLASGLYTLSFQTKDGNQVQKIVKE